MRVKSAVTDQISLPANVLTALVISHQSFSSYQWTFSRCISSDLTYTNWWINNALACEGLCGPPRILRDWRSTLRKISLLKALIQSWIQASILSPKSVRDLSVDQFIERKTWGKLTRSEFQREQRTWRCSKLGPTKNILNEVKTSLWQTLEQRNSAPWGTSLGHDLESRPNSLKMVHGEDCSYSIARLMLSRPSHITFLVLILKLAKKEKSRYYPSLKRWKW